jgi:hypothetical protein
MKIVTVEYRRLRTFGSYQNETVGATAEVPGDRSAEDVLSELRTWVAIQMSDSAAIGHSRDARRIAVLMTTTSQRPAQSGATSDIGTVTLSVELLAALVEAVTWSLHKESGHLLLLNYRERNGGCNWRGCAPSCLARKDLFLSACAVLEQALEAPVTVERAEQLALEVLT